MTAQGFFSILIIDAQLTIPHGYRPVSPADVHTAQRESRFVSGIFRCLAVALAIVFAVIAMAGLVIWVKNAQYRSVVSVLNLLWLLYAALCVFTLWKLRSFKYPALIVFALALIPRLALALAQTYTPTNDFNNYWTMGQAFLQGDREYIAGLVGLYRDYGFAGLAVLEGVTQAISGGTVLGYQCFQSVLTSLTAVLIYLLGRRYNSRVGLIAAAMYALYPGNIVMTQVFTNQHLAVFFALLSLLAFVSGLHARGPGGGLLFGALAGCLLLVSEYAHSSSLVTQIALAVYTVTICVDLAKNRKRIILALCVLAACLLTLYGVKAAVDQALLLQGYRWESTARYSYLEYVYTGLGQEMDGQLDTQERIAFILMQPDERIAAILERIKDPIALLKLFARKTIRMWGSMDSSFQWYTDAATPLQHTVASAFGALDMLFVSAAYLLAAFGWFKARNGMRRLGLPLIVLTGWLCAYLIVEIQPRYRYYGMTFVMLFAAVGGFMLWRKIRGSNTISNP